MWSSDVIRPLPSATGYADIIRKTVGKPSVTAVQRLQFGKRDPARASLIISPSFDCCNLRTTLEICCVTVASGMSLQRRLLSELVDLGGGPTKSVGSG
ncbi:hypothetical protein MTO96_000666 [Rhipicephalus appendiculatus]